MKHVALILFAALCVTGCGKKPNNLTPIVAPAGQSQLSQPYPMIQPAPPAQ